jgi:uncharacterized protein YbbC (DUF1343 family)
MRFAGNKIFVVLASVLVGANASGAVELGIDVLESNGYALLKNKRVGLVTNQTGVDSRGVRAQVLLRKNCNLVALYAPEHGLDGALRSHPQTNSAMLRGIDTLVFDLQDIGCRSYTYISTMTKCIEAAAENHIEFVVLDIPRWNSPLYYVATGLIGELHGPETDVGGARPFEILAARGVSAGSFINYMNFQYLGGITFSEYRSGAVGGSSLYIDSAAAANLTAVNIYALAGRNRQLRTNLITHSSGGKREMFLNTAAARQSPPSLPAASGRPESLRAGPKM